MNNLQDSLSNIDEINDRAGQGLIEDARDEIDQLDLTDEEKGETIGVAARVVGANIAVYETNYYRCRNWNIVDSDYTEIDGAVRSIEKIDRASSVALSKSVLLDASFDGLVADELYTVSSFSTRLGGEYDLPTCSLKVDSGSIQYHEFDLQESINNPGNYFHSAVNIDYIE